MVLGRYDDAAALLRSSTHLQGSANEMAMIKSRLQQVESIQAPAPRPAPWLPRRPPVWWIL